MTAPKAIRDLETIVKHADKLAGELGYIGASSISDAQEASIMWHLDNRVDSSDA